MVWFEISTESADAQDPRGFIGGKPPLPVGSESPACKLCGEELVHFLDLVLPPESAPFQPDSRLQIFACRQHDDIAGTIYSDYGRFESASRSRQLPDNYWELSDGHYLIRLLPPGAATAAGRPEKRLALRTVQVARIDDSDPDREMSFKLLGEPAWLQDPEEHVCRCGAPLRLLLQIPDGFGFDMLPGAAEQPNSFSKERYLLFLGNCLYLLACTRQCHPQALWPVLQS